MPARYLAPRTIADGPRRRLLPRRDWDKAFKFYQMVLVHHRDKQSKDEIVDIFYRLGPHQARGR